MKIIGLVAGLLMGGVAATAIAADFDGDSRSDPAIFRASSGLWSVPGITRFYFGGTGDDIAPGDYDGDGIDEAAVFRSSSGLWSVRNVTRTYLGASGDIPVVGGGGARIYDYVVKPGSAADLARALESTEYLSVFIPYGVYYVGETIDVSSNKKLISGESIGTVIWFLSDGIWLNINSEYCEIERLTMRSGGDTVGGKGNIYISSDHVTLSNCWSWLSLEDGFEVAAGVQNTSFINCGSYGAEDSGFAAQSTADVTRLANCQVIATDTAPACGFEYLTNLSSCFVDGNTGNGYNGFYGCQDIAGCRAIACHNSQFDNCKRISGCSAIGDGGSSYGFYHCSNVSACHAEGVGSEYPGCWKMDTDSCD